MHVEEEIHCTKQIQITMEILWTLYTADTLEITDCSDVC